MKDHPGAGLSLSSKQEGKRIDINNIGKTKKVTSSASMCQILTARMTKHVSFCVLFTALLWSLTPAAFSQTLEPSSQPLTAVSDETVEAEPSAADLEQVLADDAAENASAVSPSQDRLEEIDEASVTFQDEGEDVTNPKQVETATPLSQEVEDLKKAALELNRDLLILEEELLFPANSQIVVFLSLDVGKYFALDSVKVLIDDDLVASHLYTKRQNTALSLGGIQRLYLGNLKSGEHEVTAFFVGMGPDNREYKRGATIVIDKDDDPLLLELKVRDSSANMQPEFEFEQWQL